MSKDFKRFLKIFLLLAPIVAIALVVTFLEISPDAGPAKKLYVTVKSLPKTIYVLFLNDPSSEYYCDYFSSSDIPGNNPRPWEICEEQGCRAVFHDTQYDPTLFMHPVISYDCVPK